MIGIIDLFPKIPRVALGEQTRSIHDALSIALQGAGLLGEKKIKKNGSRFYSYSLREVEDHSGRNEILRVLHNLQWAAPRAEGAEGQDSRAAAYLTMALAAYSSGVSRELAEVMFAAPWVRTCGHEWLARGGLHLLEHAMDVDIRFRPSLLRSAHILLNRPSLAYDCVYEACIKRWDDRLSLRGSTTVALADVTFGQLAICMNGIEDPQCPVQQAQLVDTIEALSKKPIFASDPKNRRASSLRKLMRLMIFNPAYLMIADDLPAKDIDKALRPTFDTLLVPFSLDEAEADFLWRRAMLCISVGSARHLHALKARKDEVYGGDQERCLQLFAKLGVDLEQVPSEQIAKGGLDKIYDPKHLTTSNSLLAGWAHPADAFCHLLKENLEVGNRLLSSHYRIGLTPSLEDFVQGRCNSLQTVMFVQALEGFSPWLERVVKQHPSTLPSPLQIEILFPHLDLKRFDAKSRKALIGQYAHALLSTVLHEAAGGYGHDRLRAKMELLNQCIAPYRTRIPKFAVELAQAIHEVGLLTDEIMRGLELDGFVLAEAKIDANRLDAGDVLTRGLGL